MDPSISLRCFILVASCAPGTPQEYFTIHSAVDTSKCISVLHWRQLELDDCDNDLSESSQVWYWNQSWLVNRHFKYQGATQCVNFYDASFEYHGRPLRLNSCMEGMLSMDWIWEDGRIKHAHSAFCFDLPGRNFSDFAWYLKNVQSSTGLILLQLGAIDFMTDQSFILSPVPGTPPGFHPVASSPTQKPFVKASCPDGSFGERNLCPALHRPRDKSPCQGGRVQEICACPPGYYVHVFRKVLDGKWDYTCCLGEGEGLDKCGDWQFIGIVAVSMLALGIIGMVALTVALHRQQSIAPATEEDRLLETPTIRNGAHLHRTVHQSRWCVTLSDLQQFKRVVFQAVLKGAIHPTERDQFPASDTRIGPSVYTVTEQFIKPVTRDAGSVSWALMKHPEGLPCDVFITHAWAEGIYEFVDKVTHSWPVGAAAAYVCFLSNPQNLDISDLIQSPRESPFAKALESSRFVIAIPNHACSIYSRIWCVYEAFLAYSYMWDKQIRVAKSSEAIWLRMLRVSCTALATLGACILILMSQTTYYGFTASFLALVRQMRLVSFILSVLCGICICLFFVWGKHAWISCQIAICVFTILVEVFVAADLCLNGATDPPVICAVLLSIPMCGAVEGDHQQRLEASRQAQALRQGFAGTVSKAQSSSLSDLQAILAEIDVHASVREVDQTVDALLMLGLWRKELRQVIEHVGPLGDVSVWSKALFVLSSGLFVFQSFQVYRYRILIDTSTLHYRLLGVAVFEAILWPVMFLFLPVERKSFATRCLPLLLLLSPAVVGLWGGFSCDAAAHFGVIPVILLMALLGPARIAKIPVLGPPMIRMLFGRRPWTTKDSFTDSEISL